jgi:hypothetical protein
LIFEVVASIIWLALAGLCITIGSFGTAAAILSGVVTKTVYRVCEVNPPACYLNSNETSDGCMLVGVHRNVQLWYLFIGDRGVIDGLLNKSLVDIPVSSKQKALSWILYVMHTVQLLSMTFVAAQKGMDGVLLLSLMVFDMMWKWRQGDRQIVRRWFQEKGIRIEPTSFLFTGRTIMMGAIQSYSGTATRDWMNDIITKHPRREAWLDATSKIGNNIHGIEKEDLLDDSEFSPDDKKIIERTSQLILTSSDIMKRELSSGGSSV